MKIFSMQKRKMADDDFEEALKSALDGASPKPVKSGTPGISSSQWMWYGGAAVLIVILCVVGAMLFGKAGKPCDTYMTMDGFKTQTVNKETYYSCDSNTLSECDTTTPKDDCCTKKINSSLGPSNNCETICKTIPNQRKGNPNKNTGFCMSGTNFPAGGLCICGPSCGDSCPK